MVRIKIVGAGQLGSRHLQALQAIEQPLDIHVIDTSPAALEVARERFRSVPSKVHHEIRFSSVIEPTNVTDVAIVATNADIRRAVTNQLLDASGVRYLVLEKLLFSRPEDYVGFESMLESCGTRAWVNCPMRMMVPYEQIRAELRGSPVNYRVTGSNFGLVTNAIHYLDHVAHLTGCPEFSVNHTGLDATPVKSKRVGFLELNGRLVADFADGSRCEVVCSADGDTPVLVEIFGRNARYIVRENEGCVWLSSAESGWAWSERSARISYQSELTTRIVETLLRENSCPLSPIGESISIHRQLLDGLMPVVRAALVDVNEYPFT